MPAEKIVSSQPDPTPKVEDNAPATDAEKQFEQDVDEAKNALID